MKPDHTNYVVHFTKGPNAQNDLISILTSEKINASPLPWINLPAVCFTECPWSSLLDHANRYSPYGIGFPKPLIFAAGGGPAYYVRPDYFKKQEWDNHVMTFTTPFWPDYRPGSLRGDEYLGGKTIDYSHEREWRVPHDFVFERKNDIPFIILNSYEDMAKFPKDLKDDVGRNSFVLMDMYKKVEQLWPTHII